MRLSTAKADSRRRGPLFFWTLIVGVVLGSVLMVTQVGTSLGAFSSATSTSPSAAVAGALTGSHAPLAGISSFTAAPTATGCDISWSALAGTGIADGVDIFEEPGGALITAAAGTASGTHSVTTDQVVSSFRIGTRAASTWISPTALGSSTTCVNPTIVNVSAGSNATCAIRIDETLWCWGFGQWLTTAEDDYLTHAAPVQVGVATWRQITLAFSHSCGLQTDATLWCWGENWTGQLGDSGAETLQPRQIGAASDWTSVHASSYTTCGIRAAGTLWCWGRNGNGQVGDGTQTARFAPVQVGVETDWLTVQSGQGNTCGVRSDYSLWCWGGNGSGQLGDGSGTNQLVPTLISAGTEWSTSLGLGHQHTCAIEASGSLWCWGTNWFGERGAPTDGPDLSPVQVGTDTDWAQVRAGRYFTCASKVDQTLWCTGNNLDGRTGLSLSTGATTTLTQVGSDTDWELLSVGAIHTCGVRTGGSMTCFGSDRVGQLGEGTSPWTSPAVVGAATDWVSIAAGFFHTCALNVSSELYCFGLNQSGQLGQGTYNDFSPSPQLIEPAATWTDVDGGNYHTCGIQTAGTLWCWGRNNRGQLGLDNFNDTTSAAQVGVATDWTQLSTGRNHTCGVRTAGSALWCWGENDSGKIGDGTTVNRESPTEILPGSMWQTTEASFRHTCGIQTDSSLWCWGANGNGQVGDGTFVDRLTPTSVGAATDWSKVATGLNHTCALKTTGTLWCFGRNVSGQLGVGTTTSWSAPVQVGIDTDWDEVTAGENFTCARKTDATLWCWGRNSAGQFGNGTVATPVTSPVLQQVGVDAVVAAEGGWHACVIQSGTLSCFGSNDHGQLGVDKLSSAPSTVTGGHNWE